MTTQRHRINDWLAVTGGVGLFLLAIPVFAVLVFVLRAALLVVAILALAAGVVLYFTSARFRAWSNTVTESVLTYKGLRLSSDVAMHAGHGWARMVGDHVMVGADDLLPTVLGPVQRVELPPAGQAVARGDVLFRLHRGDRTVDVPSPVDGVVVTNNDVLERQPGLVNADPFRRGWAVMLRGASEGPRDWIGLRRGQDAGAWFRVEVDRLLAVVLHDAGAVPTMADGGAVAHDLYMQIDDATWRRVTEMLGGRS
jgi:glycine cleavage system H lipoate-binding protein